MTKLFEIMCVSPSFWSHSSWDGTVHYLKVPFKAFDKMESETEENLYLTEVCCLVETDLLDVSLLQHI